MPTDLILLGTAGGPTPRMGRNAPGQVVVVDGNAYVFDCGNGVAAQLVRAGIAFGDVRAVFITHNHSDHNADVGNLMLLGWSGITKPVHIFGPPPIADAMAHFMQMQRFDIETRVTDEGRVPLEKLTHVVEIDEPGQIYSDELVTVSATLVEHPPVFPAFGFRIDSKDRSIVFSGDTRPSQALIDLAQGADVLVHEVLHEPAIDALVSAHSGSRIREHLVDSHTGSDEVGKVAAAAGVDTLVLSHFVPADGSVDDETWRSAAAQDFKGTIVVGSDLMRI